MLSATMLPSLLLAVASAAAPVPALPPAEPEPELLEFLAEWSEEEAALIDAALPVPDYAAELGPASARDAAPRTVERQRLEVAAARWQGMSEMQRMLARARLERWRQLGLGQQRRLLERRDQLRHLPADVRDELRERYRQKRKSAAPTQESQGGRAPLLTPQEGLLLRDCLQRQAEGAAPDCRELLPEALRSAPAAAPSPAPL